MLLLQNKNSECININVYFYPIKKIIEKLNLNLINKAGQKR